MSFDALIAPLLRVRLLQGLTPTQFSAIAREAERVLFREGAVITDAGHAGDAAILIVSGAADSLGPMPGEREPVAAGSLIGELAMLVEHSYGTTVIARGPVKALRLTREAMHALMRDDQALADHLVAQMSSRLTAVADELRRIDETIAAPFASFSDAFASLPPPIAAPVRELASYRPH